MLIVSQDKKRTVENLNLGIRNAGEYNKNYTIYNTEIGEDLGEYKTEERAKEVLQEIVKTYVLTEQYKVEDERTQMNLMMEGILLYEMPKD